MTDQQVTAARGLDVNRYMGRWYEIACFPSLFQPKTGTNTRATYTLNPDGTIKVLNETFTDGKRGFIQGTAYKVDESGDEAKLKVKFYVPPFLPIFPITGDYWVLHLGDDYQYAVVGQPSRKYLWILSRTPIMEDEVYNELLEKAKEQGYDVSKLKKTPQSETAPPEEEVPDDKGIWWLKSLFGK
ncbi:hypothetical protein LUZ60_003009 [Juncus effusus]|nr:hypothetical protein LUZ60_003009 [Juncus effusus]